MTNETELMPDVIYATITNAGYKTWSENGNRMYSGRQNQKQYIRYDLYRAMIAAAQKQVTKTQGNVSCDLASQSGDSMAYAVASLTTAPVDLDALKRDVADLPSVCKIDSVHRAEQYEDRIRVIDYLHQRGLIANTKGAGK